MKKTIMFMAFIMCISIVNAQITFGVHANGILSNVNSSATDPSTGQTQKDNTKSLLSYKAGILVNIPVNETFTFMPQLNIVAKGGKIDETVSMLGTSYTTKGNIKLTYLELPLYILYSPNADEGFFGGLGPVVSFGLSGKSTITASGGGSTDTQSSDIKFDGVTDANSNDNNGHLKSVEFGAAIIAGYKMTNGVFINLHYNLGLSNSNPNPDSKFKNSYVGIGIGYFFNQSGK